MHALTLRQWLSIAALVIVVPYVLNQVRKPTRWVGPFFLRGMNESHSALTDWGLEHVRVERAFTILDVGCGGGRTIQKLAARASDGRVHGVDWSIGSVVLSREVNAKRVESGQVEIQQASVSKLPFGDATFDLVTAVETHYYWPDLAADAREILRVLKSGGTFVAIVEAYQHGVAGFLLTVAMTPMRAKLMTADGHRDWLTAAGFTDVNVSEERRHGWLRVTGRKA